MIRNYNELTRLEMEQVDRANTIVLIPLGATEQHGNQAPLGTDAMIAGAMPEYIKAELSKVDPDYPMLIFPVIPVGFSVEHLGFCGSISFKPDTYYHMLYDITQSLAHHGFVKIVYLICHGGNRPVVDMLARQVRADFGVLPFVLASGAFFHPDVQATISRLPGPDPGRQKGDPLFRRACTHLDGGGVCHGGWTPDRHRRRPARRDCGKGKDHPGDQRAGAGSGVY